MAIFAVIEKDFVSNRIVADSLEIVSLFFPDADLIVEETDATGTSDFGGGYKQTNNKFIPFQQYASWIFDEDLWAWKTPLEYPTDGKTYYWNEENVLWEEVPVIEPPTDANYL